MKISDDDLRAMWRTPAAEATADRSRCLTDDEWARLLAADAPDELRERAATHIASCSACAEEYSLLQPLQSWMADVERAHSPHTATWADRWLRGWSSPHRFSLAAAAATILLVTNAVILYQLFESRRESARLGTQLTQREGALSEAQSSLARLRESAGRTEGAQAQLEALQEQVARLAAPQLVGGLVGLDPTPGEVLRGSSDPQVIVAPSNAPVTVVLNHEPLTVRSTLEIVIEGKGADMRWTARAQREPDSAAVAVVFPAGYPAGQYDVRLFDVTRGRMLLGVYPIVIRYSPEGKP
jgi:hypothetical protein